MEWIAKLARARDQHGRELQGRQRSIKLQKGNCVAAIAITFETVDLRLRIVGSRRQVRITYVEVVKEEIGWIMDMWRATMW